MMFQQQMMQMQQTGQMNMNNMSSMAAPNPMAMMGMGTPVQQMPKSDGNNSNDNGLDKKNENGGIGVNMPQLKSDHEEGEQQV